MRWAQVKAKSSVGGWHNRCVTPGHGHAAGALAAPATRVKPRLSRRRLGVQATADRSDAPPDERQPHPCRARAWPPAHLPPPPDSRARSRRAAAPRATAAPHLARSARESPFERRLCRRNRSSCGEELEGAPRPLHVIDPPASPAQSILGEASEGAVEAPSDSFDVPRSGRASWNA